MGSINFLWRSATVTDRLLPNTSELNAHRFSRGFADSFHSATILRLFSYVLRSIPIVGPAYPFPRTMRM